MAKRERILLQFPEGLKAIAADEVKKYKNAIISLSPCYGACDLAVDEARAVRATKIIHYGHAPFGGRRKKKYGRIEVEFKPWKDPIDLHPVLEKSLSFLAPYQRIGVLTTIHHVHKIKDIVLFFQKNGKKAVVGKGKTLVPGQILGCDVSSASAIAHRVDVFVYIGGGMFHPLALSRIGVRTLRLDPYTKEVSWMDDAFARRNRLFRARIALLNSAKRVGILISTKIGQMRYTLAESLSQKLERCGKETAIFVGNEISPHALVNFTTFDCFVNTACPRLFEDHEKIVPLEAAEAYVAACEEMDES